MNEPLFLEPPKRDLEKTAGQVSLGDDPSTWPQQILQEVYKQAPYVADFSPHVVLTKVNPEKGYALGQLEIVNKTQAPVHDMSAEQLAAANMRVARIPIVVEARKLQPLDLLIAPGPKPSVVPLTERRLRAAMFRPNLGDTTGASPGSTSLIGALYPPYRQQFGFGSGGVISGDAGGKVAAAPVHTPTITPRDSMRDLCAQLGWSVDEHPRSVFYSQEKTASADVPRTQAIEKAAAAVAAGQYATGKILPVIASTINREDFEKFAEDILTFETQQRIAQNRYVMPEVVTPLAKYDARQSKYASMPVQPNPTVIQVRRNDAIGYEVKMASHKHWAPEVNVLTRDDVVRIFGAKVAMDADTSGAVTLTDGADTLPAEEVTLEPSAEVVKTPGMYKVREPTGKELVGLVFPNLMDFSGEVIPLALFTNGAVSALQGEIVGIPAGSATKIPEGKPQGHGAFYTMQSDGTPVVMAPITIDGTSTTPEGEGHYLVTDMDGAERQIVMSKGLEKPLCEGVECLVPAHYKWLPLEGDKLVALASSADEFMKKTAALMDVAAISIRSSGYDSYSLSGLPFNKVASAERTMVSLDDAMFLLAGAGVHPDTSVAKLAEAQGGRAVVQCRAKHVLDKIAVDVETLEKSAELSAYLRSIRPAEPLLKVAADIPDAETADAVLSLGFLNQENVGTFVAYLPHFEETQAKLGEMLLASRCGILEQVPRTSIERALRSVEEVIVGLNGLAFAA